jgi:hypothetical protein
MAGKSQPNDRTHRDFSACFGNEIDRYVVVVHAALKRTESQVYSFMPIKEFENRVHAEDGMAQMNRIYWTELLQRAHLASCTSLRRNLGWMDAIEICYSSGNYLGFAASLRGLIESVGDSADVLAKIPENIAREHKIIKRCVEGRENTQGVASRELEDELISYSHGRRVHKGEEAPASHIAKSTQYYVKLLSESAKLPRLEQLYRELCEVMHPAATSVLYQFRSALGSKGEATYQSEPRADQLYIQHTVKDYGPTITPLVYVAFDPALITLKTLHYFKIFSAIPELRRFQFALHKLADDSARLLRT